MGFCSSSEPWDLITRRQIGDPLAGHTSWVSAVVDGTPIAVTTGFDDMVRLWDLRARALANTLIAPGDRVLDVAADGMLVVGMMRDVAAFARSVTDSDSRWHPRDL